MEAAAAIVLALHLAWILWVIFGALWTNGRPLLAIFHLASLVWGIIVELTPAPCPLTLAENFFEEKAGIVPYQGGFLVHYLDRIVYPNIPESLLISCGLGVCVFNLLIYLHRYSRNRGIHPPPHRNARS